MAACGANAALIVFCVCRRRSGCFLTLGQHDVFVRLWGLTVAFRSCLVFRPLSPTKPGGADLIFISSLFLSQSTSRVPAEHLVFRERPAGVGRVGGLMRGAVVPEQHIAKIRTDNSLIRSLVEVPPFSDPPSICPCFSVFTCAEQKLTLRFSTRLAFFF